MSVGEIKEPAEEKTVQNKRQVQIMKTFFFNCAGSNWYVREIKELQWIGVNKQDVRNIFGLETMR